MVGRLLRIGGLAGVAWVAAASAALAQNSDTETAAATGSIFQPILIAKVSDLSFGVLVRPQTGAGVLTIDPQTGERTLSGQGGLASGGGPSRAQFAITGEGGQAYVATVPASMTLTRADGGETLTVALTSVGASGALPGGLGDTGQATLGVGGQVTVSSATVLGAYSGSFAVVVAYN